MKKLLARIISFQTFGYWRFNRQVAADEILSMLNVLPGYCAIWQVMLLLFTFSKRKQFSYITYKYLLTVPNNSSISFTS